MKKHVNRIRHNQADYLLVIVRKPEGWSPSSLEDVPDQSHILSVAPVASFAEAKDDLLRCNRLVLDRKLDKWAVIHSPSGDL